MDACTSQTLITLIVTLVAAFGGAFFAFKLEEKSRSSRIRTERINQAYKLRISLIWSINQLGNFNKRIEEIRPYGIIEYHPFPVAGIQSYKFDFDFSQIDALLPFGDEELIFDVIYALHRTESIREILIERAELQVNSVQPAIEELLAESGKEDISREEVEAKLGRRIRVAMTSFTDTLCKDIPNELDFQHELLDRLDLALAKLYPEMPLRDITLKPEKTNQEENV